MYILIIVLLFACSSRNNSLPNETAYQEVLQNVTNEQEKFHIVCNEYYAINIINEIQKESAKVIISNLSYHQKDTISIQNPFYEYEVVDLNEDKIDDLVLKFSDNLQCVVIILFHNNSYSIPQKCNLEMYDIEEIIYNSKKRYITYRPSGCNSNNWESNLIEFTKDSFNVLAHADIDFCDNDKSINLMISNQKIIEVNISNEKAGHIISQDLGYLWREVIKPVIEKEEGVPPQK